MYRYMENDHRKSKRTGLNVTIKLRTIQSDVVTIGSDEEIEVDVVNISEDGMAFKTEKILVMDEVYDTEIILANGEKFDSIIKIVRVENTEVPDTLYGCRFVGINGTDRFKIDVFQFLSEFGKV